MRDRRAALWIVPFLTLAACGHPEQQVVGRYFAAVNAKDEQTLSSFATVSFDRKVDGWAITETRPESRVPAGLPGLVEKVKQIDAELADNKKAYMAYFNEHPVEVDQVRELLRKQDARIPARLKQHAEDWQAFVEKERELKKALADAKSEVEREKRTVALSVGEVADLESLSGEMVTKQLRLNLTLDGGARAYLMTLLKYELQPSSTGQRLMNRWVVHDLQPEA